MFPAKCLHFIFGGTASRLVQERMSTAEPQVWDLASGPFGYALKQFSREMAAAAAAAAANPGSLQQQQKGQPMGGDWAKMWTDTRQAIPVDLEEEADKYTLTADVPGLQKSDLKARPPAQHIARSTTVKELT